MTKDYVAQELGWLDGIFTHPDNSGLFKDGEKSEIQRELSRRWRKANRVELLEELSRRHGEEKVFEVIDAIIFFNCKRDWERNGKEKDNSLDTFLKLLWEPLRDIGFEFSSRKKDNVVQYSVTRCPLAIEARKRKVEKWLYRLVCLTDEPSVTGFNPKIKFSRTQTLMQGNPLCDHCYTDMSK
jgi:hypothetical protein